MKVLIYSKTINRFAIKLQTEVLSVVGEENIHISCDIETLNRALIKCRAENPIVMIHIGNDTDVLDRNGLSDVLDDLFLIIITDSDNEETIVNCRRLYPRLLIHKNEDIGIITAVIEKRLELRVQETSRQGPH